MRVWQVFGLALAITTPALAAEFTLPQALAYPFLSDLVADKAGNRIAWVRIVGGVRNIWVADAPSMNPRQVTQFTGDDGQELTGLTWSPDGKMLIFVRGGDHDGNWPAAGGLQPNPTSDTNEPKILLWRAGLAPGSKAAKITEGDHPAISAKGEVAFIRDNQVWLTRLKVIGDADDVHRAFFDRGKDSDLAWSPDGSRLAFTSNRGDHSFVGVFAAPGTPLRWMAPTTSRDGNAVWAPDSKRLAFVRLLARGPAWPQSMMVDAPAPWGIWTADSATGAATRAWASGNGLRDSYPDVTGETNLRWMAGDRLAFLSAATNWQHLYAVPAGGGTATLLTPGDFMVEHVTTTPDGTALVYSANTGATKDDDGRRHLFRVGITGGAPEALTAGESLEWSPAALADGIAFIGADARNPATLGVVTAGKRSDLAGQAVDPTFAGADFVVPKQVTFTAPDGLLIHGQLFEAAGGTAKKPGVIFVHGGPPRQMLLGWSYMRYYSNAYAVNQYLAGHGFTVLSVNYRLGIGYGWDFQHPAKGGPAGASEYQDVLAGAQFLQKLPGVDPARIGIWGGSYGGLLTAQALGKNSDVFKAGVDIHGVHDWSKVIAEVGGGGLGYADAKAYDAALVTSYQASPVSDIATWKSPVLFIHGDDDRNVRVNQTIDLVRRLEGVDYEELIIPDEIHDFLRQHDWATVDAATVEYLGRKLGAK